MSIKSWIATKAIQGKLPLWAYRLIGKELAKKLNWEDKKMADATNAVPANAVPSKPWYQSKTVWAAIVTGLVGLIQPISGALGHPMSMPLWIIEVLTGLGLYGLRTANTTIS